MRKQRDLFPNLSAELARIGMSKAELSNKANISISSLYAKCKGDTDWTLDDMNSVKRVLETESGGQEMPLDYLFRRAQ